MAKRRGRRPNTIPTVDWKCHVALPLAVKADLLLMDPLTHKLRYGARSALVNQLLLEWLNAKGAQLSADILKELNDGTDDALALAFDA